MNVMQSNHSTWNDEACPLVIPDGMTWVLTKILDGDKRISEGTYTRPANPSHVRPCPFCSEALILPCILENGREYDASVYVDHERDEELRVNLWQPHACPYSVRYREFLDSPSEPEFRWEEEERQ
jgi:hypothetical protein